MFDKECFHLTWEDNLCYDEVFYRDNHDRLEKFVQYYESCKELKRNKHPLPDYRETRGILKPYLEDEPTKPTADK